MDQYAQRITRDYPCGARHRKENMRTYLMGQLARSATTQSSTTAARW